jgi:hypothetical protein
MLRAATVAWCLGFAATTAVGQEGITFEELLARMPADVAAELDRMASAARQSPAPNEAAREAALEGIRARTLERDAPRPVRVTGDASIAARCVSGYLDEGRYNVSAPDVTIVSERKLDCDAGGCRSFQVTTSRSSSEPYEVEVSVSCSA